MQVAPYTIEIGEALGDLYARLDRTRWPDEVDDAGWDYGTNLAYLRRLCAYWREGFDWPAQQRALNELPHFRTEIDGLGIHFVHVRGKGERSFPLIATHGWPSTFFELLKLIPLLTEGDGLTFDLVIPSMPGYGFSDRPRERFVSARVPSLWVELMARLGYERFGAHGGDIGGGIAARLGQYHADAVAGIHVTNIVLGLIREGDRPPTEAEQAHLDRQESWRRDEWAYGELQGTKPQTLSFGLNDSPAGLAGWIVEKFRTWSDCGGDVESVFSKDELLTNITIYWATQTIGSSFRPYWDFRHNPNPNTRVPISVPCGIAIFPKDLGTPPREFAERFYNVRHWTEMPRGGHFPGLEQPVLLADDIRSFFKTINSPS
jgi:pimeloyl-ACP methyl ester carboxylesterase